MRKCHDCNELMVNGTTVKRDVPTSPRPVHFCDVTCYRNFLRNLRESRPLPFDKNVSEDV